MFGRARHCKAKHRQNGKLNTEFEQNRMHIFLWFLWSKRIMRYHYGAA